jgi:hypothetical protein
VISPSRPVRCCTSRWAASAWASPGARSISARARSTAAVPAGLRARWVGAIAAAAAAEPRMCAPSRAGLRVPVTPCRLPRGCWSPQAAAVVGVGAAAAATAASGPTVALAEPRARWVQTGRPAGRYREAFRVSAVAAARRPAEAQPVRPVSAALARSPPQAADPGSAVVVVSRATLAAAAAAATTAVVAAALAAALPSPVEAAVVVGQATVRLAPASPTARRDCPR